MNSVDFVGGVVVANGVVVIVYVSVVSVVGGVTWVVVSILFGVVVVDGLCCLDVVYLQYLHASLSRQGKGGSSTGRRESASEKPLHT